MNLLNYRQYVERLLYILLPKQLFKFLSIIYRRLKEFYFDLLVYIDSLVYAYNSRLSLNKIRILNLDLYEWTGVDFLQDIEEKFGVNKVIILRHEINWEKYEIENYVKIEVTKNNYWELTYKNTRLWEVCKASIMKHLGKIIIPKNLAVSEEDIKCITKYYRWSINCYDLIYSELLRCQPDVVIVTQGGVYDSRIIAELCRKEGITVVSLENCFSSAHFLADTLSGQILNRHSISTTGDFINECDSMDIKKQEALVHKFLNSSINQKEDDHNTGNRADTDNLRQLLSIPDDKKIILFLCQVRTDASVTLDSTLYPDPIMLLEDLVKLVNKYNKYFLIIRLHPKEATYDREIRRGNHLELCYNATLKELEKSNVYNSINIRIISDKNTNTYDLMRISDLGITINSQSGLEMALLGVQVITTGRCIYANKGFTWDLTNKVMLEQTINAAIEHKYTQEEYESLIKFCYYYFYHYLIPKDLSTNMNRLYSLLGLKYKN